MSSSGHSQQRLTPRQSFLIVWGVLIPVHAMSLGWGACCHSPTSDEVAHLAAGIRIWESGKLDLYTVNPPLVKAVATLPVALESPRTDWKEIDDRPGARPEWIVGQSYLRANPQRFRWDFVVSRWMCIPFSLVGAVTCFVWSRQVFGPQAGIMAAAIWCFSPQILGNGALITPDVAAAAFGVVAVYRFRCWLVTGSWKEVLLAGLSLGIAELTKTTWLLLYGLLPVIWGAHEWSVRFSHERQSMGATRLRGLQLLCILFLSLDVLNAGYLFQGSFEKLGSFPFVSRLLGGEFKSGESGNRFQGTLLGQIPIPLPAEYVAGLDLQRRDFEGGWKPLPSYLGGKLSSTGWWYYYIYCAAVKVSLGFWLVVLCCLIMLVLNRNEIDRVSRADRWCLVFVPCVLFLMISSQTGISRYFRYVLPCLPFVAILCSSLWSNLWKQRRRWLLHAANFGMLSAVTASLWIYPHSLSFFNLLSGGPEQGHWHLLDSNLDWGQDLYFLNDWIREHPEAAPLYLAYSGVADPELFGLNALPFPTKEVAEQGSFPPGWFAISVNHLHGYDFAPASYAHFLSKGPVSRAGYSIMIYELSEVAP